MTLFVIVAAVAAVVVWIVAAYRRDLRGLRVAPTPVDPDDSKEAGGFGPEWDAVIGRG
jgi:hypothetical protein